MDLLHSSATVLDISDINQGVQYDQRGRGIKSTQSGTSQYGRPGHQKNKITHLTHDPQAAYGERGSYFSPQHIAMDAAPSDAHYQCQTREVGNGLLDQRSRIQASEQRHFHSLQQ